VGHNLHRTHRRRLKKRPELAVLSRVRGERVTARYNRI
jgi:hypothetical protein